MSTGTIRIKSIETLPLAPALDADDRVVIDGPSGGTRVSPANNFKGEKGDRGDAGPRGLTGFQGIPGLPGPVGPQGPGGTGPPGKDGKDGINGTNGVNGVDGQDGADGAPGLPGQDGTDGINGTNGVDGNDGWTMVPALIVDGTRVVNKIQDYTGGEGTKPGTVGFYVGATGLVSDIALAVDVRGPAGTGGSSTASAVTVSPPVEGQTNVQSALQALDAQRGGVTPALSYYWSDFILSNTVTGSNVLMPWGISVLATGTVVVPPTAGVVCPAHHPGVFEIRCSTSGSSGGAVHLQISQITLVGGESCRIIFKIPSGFPGTGFLGRFGFSDSVSTGLGVDQVCLRWVGMDVDGSIRNNNNPSGTTGGAFTCIADTWYTGLIEILGTTDMRFTIFEMDGTNKWTRTVNGNVPIGRDVGHSIVAWRSDTPAAAVPIMVVDWMDILLPCTRV